MKEAILIITFKLLYSRLMVCKSLAAKLAADGSTSFLPNPVALDLGLTDTAGPSGYFADLASGTFPLNHSRLRRRPARGAAALTLLLADPSPDSRAVNPAEHFYLHLLDLVEKVFDGELEQTTFEENMRFMFGTRAYVVFTLDKLCAAICKQVRGVFCAGSCGLDADADGGMFASSQVQAVVQDFRCHELMSMLEQQRGRDAEMHAAGAGADVAAIQDVIRYRRQAEALVGADENLFRIDWVRVRHSIREPLMNQVAHSGYTYIIHS